MNHPMNNPQNHVSVAVLCGAAICLLSTACTSVPRIYTDKLPPGSHRLAQVMVLGTRKELVETKDAHDILSRAGIPDAEIRDGSVVLARIYCCGGWAEKPTAPAIYVPPGINVERGDIVELRVGHPPKKGAPGELNTVIRVRQKADDQNGSCRWDPPNERLWMRILYADWMPQEGWVYKGGISKAWYKPPTNKP